MNSSYLPNMIWNSEKKNVNMYSVSAYIDRLDNGLYAIIKSVSIIALGCSVVFSEISCVRKRWARYFQRACHVHVSKQNNANRNICARTKSTCFELFIGASLCSSDLAKAV